MTNTDSFSFPAMTYFEERVPCGFPTPAAECQEGFLDFNRLLSSDKASIFCLRATGDSMIGAGIYPDDILVCDRAQPPRHNTIVIAEYEGGFTVKRLLRPSPSTAILHPENPLYPDIVIPDGNSLQVFGVITAVVRLLNRATHGRTL